MVINKILIIEGAKDTRNGILRQGFNKLLSQKLSGNMPRIVMGEGKKQSINKFINFPNNRIPHLLIDLDGEENTKSSDLKDNNLNKNKETVFFMIQEMEAWFLSQPEILDDYYNDKITRKIPNRPPKEIPNPSDKLHEITEKTKKGKYHKVKHAVDLLQQLDATKLMVNFDDFRNLITTLKI